MSLEDRLERWLADPEFRGDVAALRTEPARAGRTAPLPAELHPDLAAALSGAGMAALYEHQASAIRAALAGRSVAVATGTASGKSLCYVAPILDAILRDRRATALLLFPTKALTQDQVHNVSALLARLEPPIAAGTYDGDTPPDARRRLRDDAAIVATNPYMLHSGILPNHPKWVRFFAGLRYVVVDEMHSLTGVFGSHVANVLRRLRRVAAHYGADPAFILCSATIRNPGELARALVGRPVELVADDASPRGVRHLVHLNPPIVNRDLGLRRNGLDEARRVVGAFAPHGVQTIVFAGSRNSVELLVRYLKEDWERRGLDPGRVRGYRGGYLPELRRTIERELKDGALDVVVSTNALELGIDIGSLDLAVVAGYPRSRAAFFQQAGRAGRRSAAAAVVLVGRSTPLDQYVMRHPEYLHGAPPEAAAVDPDNLVIRVSHLKCAAFELPFCSGEAFGGEREGDTREILDFLAREAGVLRQAGDRWLYAARGAPAAGVSLDASDVDNVVIHDVERGRVLAEVDRASAQTFVHDGAIYQHQGETYQVRKLDWDGRRADVEQVAVDYYTEANTEVEVRVLTEDAAKPLPGATCVLGDVTVSKTVTMYQKLRFHTREDVGTGLVHLPAEELETTACILAVDEQVAADSGLDGGGGGAGLKGLARLLRGVAPLLVRCAPGDLGIAAEPRSPHFLRPAIFVFDDLPGGVGLAEALFERAAEWLAAARAVLEECGCDEGCPACIGPSPAGADARATALRLARRLAP